MRDALPDRTIELRKLAVEIFRCPVLEATILGEETPCRDVVSWQGLQGGQRYLPEPWTGHLGEAPILFVSSNPSAGEREECVDSANWNTSESSDEDLFRAADGAFDAGQRPGIADGTYLLDRRGQVAGRSVPYWRWNRRIAAEILGCEPTPGRDYALTEVVHCGSRQEFGVLAAASTCAGRYLQRILRASPAGVIVVAGDKALALFEREAGIAFTNRTWGPGELLGTRRIAVALPHPNRRGSRWGLAPHLGPATATTICEFARSRTNVFTARTDGSA